MTTNDLAPGDYPRARWMPTHVRLPGNGQQVTWFTPAGGQQIDGTYVDGRWVQCPVEGCESKPVKPVDYIPSSWKPR